MIKVLLFLLLLEKLFSYFTNVKIYSPVKGLSIAATINCAQTFIKLATDKSPRELVRFIFRILIFLKLSIWSAFLNPFFFENSPLFKLFCHSLYYLKVKDLYSAFWFLWKFTLKMIEYKDAMWILDIKISLILSKTIHCEKWNILKRANSFVCELLTCKGDKQATLEENNSRFLPHGNMKTWKHDNMNDGNMKTWKH